MNLGKSIAILGYGETCPELNKGLAFQAGRFIALRGATVCTGNLGGTFHHSFMGAKSVAGHTIVFLLDNGESQDTSLCDEVIYASNADDKHEMIARRSSGAIVIGGGPGTSRIIRKLLALDKVVVAIKRSGGVAENDLDARVTSETDIAKAVEIVLCHV